MLLLALFGSVALVLSAIGIYGVLAFGVAQRRREIGIRQALGADRRSILSLVLKQGMSTAGIGVGLGLAGSIDLRDLPGLKTRTAPAAADCAWPARR
jgi:ABC-type antimicrobial peptide transport system permease subunit